MARLSPDQLDPRNNMQYYTKAAAKDSDFWDDKAVRQEYSRLRDIAQKRLKRLAESEPKSLAYRRNVGQYPAARAMTTAEIREKLPQIARFIAAKTGTVSGIRAQHAAALRTLHEHGYTGINKGNIREFGEFMDEWRDSEFAHVIGSPEVVEFFEFTREQDIPWDRIKKNFDKWLEQRNKIKQYAEMHDKVSPAKFERFTKYASRYPHMSADKVIELFDDLEARKAKERAEKRRAACAKS